MKPATPRTRALRALLHANRLRSLLADLDDDNLSLAALALADYIAETRTGRRLATLLLTTPQLLALASRTAEI